MHRYMVRIVRRRRVVRRRMARRGKSKTKPLKGFTRLQTRTLKRAVARQEETKYFAQQMLLNQSIDPAIHTPGTDIVPLCPLIPQGTQSWNRVGAKVKPVKCRVDFNIAFAQPNPGQTGKASADFPYNLDVVVYVLRTRTIRNWQQYQATASWNKLLSNGDGTESPFGVLITPTGQPSFWSASTQDLMKPVNTNEHIQLHRRVIRLVKNYGITDGAIGPAGVGTPNALSTSYRGSMSYQLPELLYDDNDGGAMGGYPTNVNVVFAVGWTFADNNGTYGIDANSVQFPLDQLVTVTARNHVWYKDA